MPKFLCRSDFWGTFIDLAGLTILLSYDIPFLRSVLMRVPALKRRSELLVQLKSNFAGRIGIEKLERYFRAVTLEKSDVTNFLDLFPALTKEGEPPNSVNVFIYYDTMRSSLDPYIVPSLADSEKEPPALAVPIRLSTAFEREELLIHNLVYTVGFVLMFLGSALILGHIIFG